jgi:hypothetical protein
MHGIGTPLDRQIKLSLGPLAARLLRTLPRRLLHTSPCKCSKSACNDNRSLNQSLSQSVAVSISRCLNQSLSQSVAVSISRCLNQSLSQSVVVSISRSLNQSLSQSVAPSINMETAAIEHSFPSKNFLTSAPTSGPGNACSS